MAKGFSRSTGNTSSFEPAPKGTHPAVIVDVWVDYDVEGKFGTRDYVTVVHELSRIFEDDEGNERNFVVWDSYLNYSANAKSKLMQRYGDYIEELWDAAEEDGQDPDEGIDLFGLVGYSMLVKVDHREKEGRVFANVVGVMDLPDSMDPVEPSGDYTPRRMRDAEQEEKPKRKAKSNGKAKKGKNKRKAKAKTELPY